MQIETNYEHLWNDIDFDDMREQDWYAEKGAAIGELTSGLVQSVYDNVATCSARRVRQSKGRKHQMDHEI